MLFQESSLVVQTSQLGDVVLTTPLIARLAQRGPVDVITTRRCAGLLRQNPDVRSLIVFDKNGSHKGLLGLLRFAAHLRHRQGRRGRYAAAYLAQGSVRSAALAALAGVRERVGFDTSAGASLCRRSVRYAADEHHALRLWRLGGPGEPELGEIAPRLFPSAGDVRRAGELLRECPPGLPIYALAPGSRRGTKRWPHFANLARLLGEKAAVVVLGGPEDRQEGETIRAARGHNVTVNLAGAASLLTAAAALRRAAVLVCNDSAAQHMAAATGTPVVAVFGPTLPSWGFGPLSPHAVVLEPGPLACRPCAKEAPHTCPQGHWRCMTETTQEIVMGTVQDLISRSLVRVDSGR